MSSGFHHQLSGANIHVIHRYTYADAAERLAATGFQETDVGAVALQEDTQEFYVLLDEDPITWSLFAYRAGASGSFVAVDPTTGATITVTVVSGRITAIG